MFGCYNYIRFLQPLHFCYRHPKQINMDMESPLQNQAVHPWFIDIFMSETSLFLLRDHVTLLQDLMADWTARPAPDFAHFMPYRYFLRWVMDDAKIFLCANEQNIISQPNDLADNGRTMPPLQTTCLTHYCYQRSILHPSCFTIET